jgi:hypothetical protein
VVGEDVLDVSITFNGSWAKVFVSHDNNELFRVLQVIEDPALEHQQVWADTALVEAFFKMEKKVVHVLSLQHVWDHGFGCLPVTG